MIDFNPLVTTITQTSQIPEDPNVALLTALAPYFLFGVILVIWRIFRWLGGWPEAYYRISGINYFVATFFMPSGEPITRVFKESDLTHESPTGFEWKMSKKAAKGGRYYIDDTGKRSVPWNGRRRYFYNWDESEPIPIRGWKDKKDRWDPQLIWTAFKSMIAEKMHTLGVPVVPKSKSGGIAKTIAWIAILTLAMVAAYYSFNTYCALGGCKGGLGIP